MSVRYVCDACGADATEEKFLMPMLNTYTVMGNRGRKLASFSKTEKCAVNLCVDCQAAVAGLLDSIERAVKKG